MGGGGASKSPYSDWARDPTELKSDASRIGDGAREFLDEGTNEGANEGANEGSIDPESLPGVWMV